MRVIIPTDLEGVSGVVTWGQTRDQSSAHYQEARRLLMADIEAGLYITSLMGMGVNGVTGDYSRGASGFWIENGEITFPVTELTIAGNLNQMFAGMSRANDLAFRFGTNSPTVRIDGLIVAGGGE